MKTGMVFGVGLVVGVSIAGIYVTKNGYEDFITEQSGRLLAEAAPGATIMRTVLSDGFFSVEDQFVVSFDLAAAGFPGNDRVQLEILNSCTILPFYMTCSDTFSYKASAELETLTQPFSNYDYQSGWSASPITGNVSGWLHGAPFTSESDKAFTLGSLELKLGSDLSFSALEVEFSLDKASMNADGANMRISNAAMTADLTDIKQNSWIGTNTFTLDGFTADSGDGSEITLSKLLVSSVTSEYAENKYDLNYVVRADTLTVNQPGLASKADNVDFDIRLYGISAKALDLLQEFEQADMAYPTIEKQLIEELGSSEPGLTINTMSLTLNEAPINASGEITFDPFTYQDYEDMSVAAKAHGKVTALFSGELETAAPAMLPVLQQSIQTGMLVQDENGDFVTDIVLENGTLTVNGNVLGQF